MYRFYNDEENGLQIIANANVTDVTLGSNELTEEVASGLPKVMASYNNAVDILNNKSEEYKGSKAKDARSVGSIAKLNKNGLFQKEDTFAMYEDVGIGSERFDGKLKVADSNYVDDEKQIKLLKIYSSDATWLASRYAEIKENSPEFGLYCITKWCYKILIFDLEAVGYSYKTVAKRSSSGFFFYLLI